MSNFNNCYHFDIINKKTISISTIKLYCKDIQQYKSLWDVYIVVERHPSKPNIHILKYYFKFKNKYSCNIDDDKELTVTYVVVF